MTFLKRSQLLVFVLIAACGDGGTGPDDTSVSIAVQSGDAQFGSPSTTLLDPLQVVVIDPVSKDAVEGITVSWTVTSGSGALISPLTSETDENGVATTMVRLGSSLGEYVVEARAGKLIGEPARFRARAVSTPTITSAP